VPCDDVPAVLRPDPGYNDGNSDTLKSIVQDFVGVVFCRSAKGEIFTDTAQDTVLLVASINCSNVGTAKPFNEIRNKETASETIVAAAPKVGSRSVVGFTADGGSGPECDIVFVKGNYLVVLALGGSNAVVSVRNTVALAQDAARTV
jgi:hypothetical protein